MYFVFPPLTIYTRPKIEFKYGVSSEYLLRAASSELALVN